MAFLYFGYGSNMAERSLRAKGVAPRASERAVLPGWRLRFNVQHFFRHEGGVGNIERVGDPKAEVWGVLHICEDEHLELLDAAEAYPHGYDQVSVSVLTDGGERQALAYVGAPAFLNDACLPTRRYLSLLLEGAAAAGLDPGYIEALRRHPLHENPPEVAKFEPPPGNYPAFTAESLARQPLFTALAGAVFDMSEARWQHRLLHGPFGGKDMTLFHLMRMDTATGRETLDDVKHDRLNESQRLYLNRYLEAYALEYRYVGRYRYD